MSARYEIIVRWANERQWTHGAEIGVSDGRTLLYLLENCPQLNLIGVDVWDLPDIPQVPTLNRERCNCEHCRETKISRRTTTQAVRERMTREGAARFADRATIHKMQSRNAAALVADGSLDFVFIDADHSELAVSADIAGWRGKIRPGGMLIGHDWNVSSVRAGCLRHFKINQIETAGDHLWFVQC